MTSFRMGDMRLSPHLGNPLSASVLHREQRRISVVGCIIRTQASSDLLSAPQNGSAQRGWPCLVQSDLANASVLIDLNLIV